MIPTVSDCLLKNFTGVVRSSNSYECLATQSLELKTRIMGLRVPSDFLQRPPSVPRR